MLPLEGLAPELRAFVPASSSSMTQNSMSVSIAGGPKFGSVSSAVSSVPEEVLSSWLPLFACGLLLFLMKSFSFSSGKSAAVSKDESTFFSSLSSWSS